MKKEFNFSDYGTLLTRAEAMEIRGRLPADMACLTNSDCGDGGACIDGVCGGGGGYAICHQLANCLGQACMIGGLYGRCTEDPRLGCHCKPNWPQ